MARNIIDLSTPIITDHFRWPVERKQQMSHANGDIVEISWLGWAVHGFTHMDSARHFDASGYSTSEIDLDQVIGSAAVVDLTPIDDNSPIDLERISAAGSHIKAGDIVVMKTAWDTRYSLQQIEFWTQAPYMTDEASQWLFDQGIKAIAFDFPQDKCIRDFVTGDRTPAFEENTTHIELLLKGIPMFEYLCNTAAITRPRVEFFGLPIKVPDCDGAPARVIAIEDGE